MKRTIVTLTVVGVLALPVICPTVDWAGTVYLMSPPVDRTEHMHFDAPLASWDQFQTFDSAYECSVVSGWERNASNEDLARYYDAAKAIVPFKVYVAHAKNSACIASDDSRLR
jgi:hypothetical protein